MEKPKEKIVTRVIDVTPPPTREQLEQSIKYWRDLACEQQQLAYKRRPLLEKAGGALGYIFFTLYCLYQITFKGRTGPFS